ARGRADSGRTPCAATATPIPSRLDPERREQVVAKLPLERASFERLERGGNEHGAGVRVAVDLARRGDALALEAREQTPDVDPPVASARRPRQARIVEPVRVLEELTEGRVAEHLRARAAEHAPSGHVVPEAVRAELAPAERGDEELGRAARAEHLPVGGPGADRRVYPTAVHAERDDRAFRRRMRARLLESAMQSRGPVRINARHRRGAVRR